VIRNYRKHPATAPYAQMCTFTLIPICASDEKKRCEASLRIVVKKQKTWV
jgi:hypothetical protein